MKTVRSIVSTALALLLALCMALPALAATVTTRPAPSTTKKAAATTKPATTKASASTTKTAEATTKAADTEKKDSTKQNKQATTGERAVTSRTLSEILNSFNDPNGRVLAAAKSGMPRLYPEDSLAGIQACIDNGIDIVSVSVQKTSDGKLVVMEDSSLSRMCVNEIDGKTASGTVSKYTLSQMTSEFFLRNGRGGPNRAATTERVPSLEQAIQKSKDGCMLYIRNGWKYANEVNTAARNQNACSSVIIGGAVSTSKVQDFLSTVGTPVCHIAAFFDEATNDENAKSYLKAINGTGIDTVLLQSEKDYSSIFKESTFKKFDGNGRAMISATKQSLCGSHKDTIEGWEQLIESGYSIIETDYPKELATYISDIEAYRTELKSLLVQAGNVNEAKYEKSSVKDLDAALANAETVSKKGAVSRTQVDNARYDLQESLDALDTGETVPKKKTNPITVILIVVVILLLLFLLVLILLRKRNQARKAKKAQKKNPPKPAPKPAPKAEPKKAEPKPESRTDDAFDPDDPDLKAIAKNATKEVSEGAKELAGKAKENMKNSGFMKKARAVINAEDEDDEDFEEAPSKQAPPAPDKGTVTEDDDGLSLFDLYDGDE